MSSPLRVLCLDMETGFGGSSRSLWFSLRDMDRSQVRPEVWRYRPSVYDELYASIGVPCRLVEEFPKAKAVARTPANLYVFGRGILKLASSRGRVRSIAREIRERFDVVHCNLESFFLFARAIRRRSGVPMVMHMRSTMFDNPFTRWQVRRLSRVMDDFVFITENERDDFIAYGGDDRGSVIYNIVDEPRETPAPLKGIDQDSRLRIACLSNYAYARGVDRLVGIAESLKAEGGGDILFVVAGNMKLAGKLPGELGTLAARGGTLADYAAARGVADMFRFTGHVQEPERVLVACHALIKPSRHANPWGRDVLEAMSFGLPVFGFGAYSRFVETGRTGILYDQYEPGAVARDMMALHGDRERLRAMGEAARERVARLCNGQDRAADLVRVWRETAGR